MGKNVYHVQYHPTKGWYIKSFDLSNADRARRGCFYNVTVLYKNDKIVESFWGPYFWTEKDAKLHIEKSKNRTIDMRDFDYSDDREQLLNLAIKEANAA